MQIDWLTVVAQIVNFLVLVWLLKRFLYGPIIGAMERREAAIQARVQDAEAKAREAAGEADAYREKQADLDRRRDAVLAEAENQALQLRRKLEEDARQDVATRRSDWLTQLQDQQGTLLGDMRRRAAEFVCGLGRRALSDLADAQLEDQIATRLTDRLAALDRETKRKIIDACSEDRQGIVVRSAFELSSTRRGRLTRAIHEALGQAVEVEYRTSPDIACGLELKAGSHSVSWSLDGYLDDLEHRLSESLGELTVHASQLAVR
jgi:F-type H+-transporting ATPase subunit b